MADLSDIVTSRVRTKVLELFFSDPSEMYHVRGAVREMKEEINAVRRELISLDKKGLLKSEKRGNRVYYWANKEYLMFGDYISIVAKVTGLGKELIANRKKLGKATSIMFSGRFARHMKRKDEDDVDILLVGKIELKELANMIRKEESIRGHEINYTVMPRSEFLYRKKHRDPFLLGILSRSRVMVIGDEETLVA